MIVLTPTPVAPFPGTVQTTLGAAAVVKVQTKLAQRPTPAGSFAPVVIVAVNKMLLARIAVGVNVAVVPAQVTTPGSDSVPAKHCAASPEAGFPTVVRGDYGFPRRAPEAAS
jgi:hypothetical protein